MVDETTLLEPTEAELNPKARSCILCHKRFSPKQPRQNYCKTKCRQKALRLRKRADEHAQTRGQQRVLPERLFFSAQAQRLKSKLPTIRRHPFLTLSASVFEAELRLQWWAQELDRRRRAFDEAKPPIMRVGRRVLKPGDPLEVSAEFTHLAIVSTDGSVGVALMGIAAPEVEDPEES